LVDYGHNVDEAKKIKTEITTLQKMYQDLIEESATIRKKIQKSQLIAQMHHNSDHAMRIS
jgi:flagellar biosynthesis component FlhA